MDPDGIEECTPLLQHTLACFQLAIMYDLPTYSEWLLDASLDATYAFWMDGLRLIGCRDEPGLRWILKSPLHLIGYSALIAAAPDVEIIHIRRPAADFFASFLNLTHAGRKIFAKRVDPTKLGADWLVLWTQIISRSAARLEAAGCQPIVVDYDILLAQPWRTTAELCERLGLPIPSASAVESVVRTLSAKHRYNKLALGYFDLNTEKVLTRLWTSGADLYLNF